MITLDEIKKKIEEVQAKSVVSSEMRAFITLVLTFVNKSKEELASIGNDNLKKFKDAIGEYSKEHEKIISNAVYNTEEKKKEFDKKAKDLEVLIAHLESLKLENGKPGDDGHTPIKGDDYFTDDDKKELCEMVMGMMEEDMTAEEMVAEINKLPLDDDKKIDASHIKNLPESNGYRGGGLSKATADTLYAPLGQSGVTLFTELLDVPNDYTGQGGKGVRVKADVTGLEFYAIVDTDEKVKFNDGDPTAGYLSDKMKASTGISLMEGVGADENKMIITNTAPFVDAVSDGSTYGRKDGGWVAIVEGLGDMILSAIQSVTGLKTFDKEKFAMKGTSTGVNTISVANTSSNSYTNTIPAKDGTFAMLDDVTGTDEKVKYDVNDPTAGYVADKIVAGTGISVAEGTGGNENKLVVNSTITQYTDEMAQDAVGNAVGNGLDYDDATGAISVDESELSLPFLKLDQTTPQSVINGAPVFEALAFDTTPSTTIGEAKIQWNSVDGTFDMGMLNGSVLQVGQEMYFYGKASGNIANGELCEFAGVEGDHILIKKAVGAEIEANPHYLIGVATNNITNGNYGYITWFGKINGIYTKTPANGDTVDWVAGDILYFNIATGQLTKVKPSAPNRIITVSALIKEQTGASETGVMVVRPQIGMKLEELDDVDGGVFDTNGQTLVFDNDKQYFTVSNALPISHHYTGFPNQSDTAISFNDGTYTFTLTATDDKIWIDGIEYTIDTLEKALTVAQEAVTGLYWFWITAPLGVPQLNCANSAPGFDKCLVATVYWNTTTNKGILSDERHWMGRDKWMHEYLHETVGARYASGMTGTFADTTFTITDGEFYDEDIEHQLGGDITTAKVLYHNGDSDWAWDVLTTPYKVVNPGVDNNLRYNNGNALATVDNNKYVNYWVFVTGDETHPIHIVIGTAQYVTLANARAAAVPSLGGLGTAENKLIYKITYQNNGGTPDYNESIDYRTASSLPSGSVATDHGTLTGLTDLDHPASAIINTPAGGIVATTVQGAIDELDTAKAPTASPTFTGTITLADNCRIDLTLPTADTYVTGNTTDSFAAGYSSAVGDLVFFGSGGKWLEVDADAVATCKGLMGIALEAKNDTEAMKVALPGSMVRWDTWNWTVGATLYAGETLGAIQETIPTGADAIIRVIGFAVSADVIFFMPSSDQQSTVA